ncbi:MAG: TetR/AcrR family transcriptional regulator [Pseudomonadota bacterium]
MSSADATAISDGKRARAKAANRQSILDAARIVFARIGYEATTIRDIIRQTDLAAGTFYNYFKSKEEVFEALSNESTRRFRPVLRAVREASSDFEGFIEGAYRAFFQFVANENHEAISHGGAHTAMLGIRVDTPEMKAIFDEIRNDIETMLPKDLAPSLDTEYLTAAAIGIAREVADHMLQRRPADVDGATHFATTLMLSAMTGFFRNSDIGI